MKTNNVEIRRLTRDGVDGLEPLVDLFVQAHPSLPFREDCWAPFREWLAKTITNEDALCLTATRDGRPAGFILAEIRDNVPIFSPEKVGHVNILVVDPRDRMSGIGLSLWSAVREWFVYRGMTHFQLYTEYGNKVSGPFWKNRGFETLLEMRRLV